MGREFWGYCHFTVRVNKLSWILCDSDMPMSLYKQTRCILFRSLNALMPKSFVTHFYIAMGHNFRTTDRLWLHFIVLSRELMQLSAEDRTQRHVVTTKSCVLTLALRLIGKKNLPSSVFELVKNSVQLWALPFRDVSWMWTKCNNQVANWCTGSCLAWHQTCEFLETDEILWSCWLWQNRSKNKHCCNSSDKD